MRPGRSVGVVGAQVTTLTDEWASRSGDAWLERYWNSAHEPFRDVIVEAVGRLSPFRTLVEVGCHCGPNLYRLASRFRASYFHGLDVNDHALRFGREKMKFGPNAEFGHVWLEPSSRFGLDKPTFLEADILLSCYSLAYADQEMVHELFVALRDRPWMGKPAGPGLLRVDRVGTWPKVRALVLAEPTGDGELIHDPPSIAEYQNDYISLVKEVWPDSRLTIDLVTPPHGRLALVMTADLA
jgi:hypothetical protein